jgi:phosphoribosylaminoimidazole-succinocarboxamide synthase
MTNLPPVLYRGSVKNVRGEVSAKSLMFEFSDRYSVFDWGEMPDQIQDKGKALAIMGKSFFQFLGDPLNWKKLFSSPILQETFSIEYLKALESSDLYHRYCKEGIAHHALLDESLDSAYLAVKNIAVVRPYFDGQKYHYEAYKNSPVGALVPLEVIFRLGLPPGNSLSKRLGTIPEKGLLKNPIIDFSTKLEKGDRYMNYEEAQTIAGMNDDEWGELLQMTHLIALNLFLFHHELGLELWDGKIEVAFTKGETHRSFMLVDSIGIDELRLLYKGKSFSKEFLREVYKDSSWYQNLELSKKESQSSGVDFKKICSGKYHSVPEKLPVEMKERAESVYKIYSNAVSEKVFGKVFFDDDLTLESYSKRYL